MKKYKPCEVCRCEECQTGEYREGSWFCPIQQKQICEVCCHFDSKDEGGEDLSIKCKSLKCKHLF
jgi:hypothetical protein